MKYPPTLYVKCDNDAKPVLYQGRIELDHLPVGDAKILIAEYKLVRQIEVRREVVKIAEVG